MLQLRPEQVAALSAKIDEALVTMVIGEVETHWAVVARSTPPDALRERVRELIAKCRQHGFRTESQVLRYVNVAMALGDDFESLPAMAEIAAKPLTPGEKVEMWVLAARAELRRRGR